MGDKIVFLLVHAGIGVGEVDGFEGFKECQVGAGIQVGRDFASRGVQ